MDSKRKVHDVHDNIEENSNNVQLQGGVSIRTNNLEIAIGPTYWDENEEKMQKRQRLEIDMLQFIRRSSTAIDDMKVENLSLQEEENGSKTRDKNFNSQSMENISEINKFSLRSMNPYPHIYTKKNKKKRSKKVENLTQPEEEKKTTENDMKNTETSIKKLNQNINTNKTQIIKTTKTEIFTCSKVEIIIICVLLAVVLLILGVALTVVYTRTKI